MTIITYVVGGGINIYQHLTVCPPVPKIHMVGISCGVGPLLLYVDFHMVEVPDFASLYTHVRKKHYTKVDFSTSGM